jgi:hypothetical protein
MGLVVLRCPWTLGRDGAFATTIARQNAYVASDPRSALAYHDTCTYVDNNTLVEGYANGTHFDRAGGHAIAVGPDVAGTTKSILTALQELIAAGS